MKAVAQKYIDQGYQPLPLDKSGDGKGIFEEGWKTKEYTANRFSENNNIGLNLKLSKLTNVDPDSENAVYFCPKFLPATATLAVKSPDGKKIKTGTSYFYKGGLNITCLPRKYPNGAMIAELRGEGNIVVAPSVAESRFFNKEFCERVWVNDNQPVENSDLEKQFNKVCVASVLRDYIKGFNMPIVKLVACLNRYCVKMDHWSVEELYDFVETVVDSIPNTNKKDKSERKKVRSKIKAVLNNWDKDHTRQAGYESFAEHVGLEPEYARDMFTWIGEVPVQGTTKDRKTILSFKDSAMTEEDFHKEIVRTYLAAGIICDVGLYILAGRPKGGKSRVLKDLAYRIQNPGLGGWLGHAVANGDVLLLALEDNEDSMNLDIKQMGYQNLIKPTTFVGQCPSLDRGLEESIRLWTEEVSNPKLVIIDTFQKIKPLGEQKTRNANAYEVDYHYLSKLHSLAKELKICIIYVHHLSQADKAHSWDKIMGSTGHQGVTDAMYMLEREEGSNKATFKGIGRNIAEFKLDLNWNSNPKQPFTFQYDGDSFKRQTAKHKREIFKAMVQLSKDGSESVKPVDVYKVLNLVNNKEKDACQKNMLRMREKVELIEGDGYGTYKLPYPIDKYDEHGNFINSLDL